MTIPPRDLEIESAAICRALGLSPDDLPPFDSKPWRELFDRARQVMQPAASEALHGLARLLAADAADARNAA